MAGFLCSRHHGLEVGQTVVPVHLHGVVHHHTVAVVVRHHVFGKAVDGVLDPRFFRVDHHAYTGRGRGFAQGTDAPLNAHPCRLVFSAQGFAARHGLPHFFKQGVGRQSAHLEYGKGMAGVAVRSLNRCEDFAARRVEVGLGGLAFRAVIQNGAHVVGPKLLDGVLRICDGFPPTKVRVHGGANGPTQWNPKRQGQLGERTSHMDQPGLANQRKQRHGATQIGVGQVLKRLGGVAEPREVGLAHRGL